MGVRKTFSFATYYGAGTFKNKHGRIYGQLKRLLPESDFQVRTIALGRPENAGVGGSFVTMILSCELTRMGIWELCICISDCERIHFRLLF